MNKIPAFAGMTNYMTLPYWPEAKIYLSKRDKTLAAIIKSYKGEVMKLREGDGFYTLARAIAGQQISVKAADSVWKRFETALGIVTPDTVANAPAEIIRPCGFSASKAVYLHSLANHFLENKKTIRKWPKMADEEIIRELTSIKGIGKWTAEMFLMFSLGRPDVFPIDDLGLRKGICRHYNKGEELPLSRIKAIGEGWRPYRTVATWYIWRALDPVPVAY